LTDNLHGTNQKRSVKKGDRATKKINPKDDGSPIVKMGEKKAAQVVGEEIQNE